MPQPKILKETREDLEALIQRIDNSVNDKNESVSEDGDFHCSISASHGSIDYRIQSEEGRESWTILYSYSIWTDILRKIVNEDTPEGEPISVEEHHRDEADEQTKELLNDVGGEMSEKIRFKLISSVANPQVGYRLLEDDGTPYGLEISRKIFPMEDDFGPAQLSDSVQAVITTAVPGKLFLQRLYGFRGQPETNQDPRPEDDSRHDRTYH